MRAASHVLQANCSPKQGEEYQPNIAFQEYSENYVHERFTVGVAGFPGGPDWYINLVDNLQNHGPGGQHPTLANPCIGKIVSGFETVAKIQQQPHNNTGFEGLHKAVLIKTAVVKRQL